MKKLYGILFTALMCFSFASTSHAETSDLLKLLGDREFWTTFNWAKFEDTQLYKAADWRPPGWPFRSGVTVTSNYTIKIAWAELNVDMTLNEDSGGHTPYAERKDLKLIYGATIEDDYNKFIEWCNKNFGDAVVNDQKSEKYYPQDGTTRYTVISSWEVGNTTISVTSEQVLSNTRKFPHPFSTLLKFEKNLTTRIPLEKTEGEERVRRGEGGGVAP